jgi:maltooligosyltrehalose synthase
VIAFARTHGDEAVIAVTARHFARLGARPTGEIWTDTKIQLPPHLASLRFHEALTDRPLDGRVGPPVHALPLAEALAHLPVALISGRR